MSPGMYCIIRLRNLYIFQPSSPLYSIHPLRMWHSGYARRLVEPAGSDLQ
jgi:hypothetical protein